jgi:hypothetical protein
MSTAADQLPQQDPAPPQPLPLTQQRVDPPRIELPRQSQTDITNNRLAVMLAGLLIGALGTLGGLYIAFNERLSALEHRTEKLDDMRLQQQLTITNNAQLLQKTNDHIAEIGTLRTKVSDVETMGAKYEQAINDNGVDIGKVEDRQERIDDKQAEIIEHLAKVRERLSSLERAVMK